MNRKDSPLPPAWTEPLRRGEGPSLRDTPLGSVDSLVRTNYNF
jgi:hypothetical protein